MRKVITTIVCLIIQGFACVAQDRAIGIRMEGGDNYGALVSYQHPLGGSNRLEGDVGFGMGSGYDAFHIAALYHWVNVLDIPEPGFSWFYGPGASMTFWSTTNDFESDSGFDISIIGQVGIEYNFDFPLQLTLDLEPAIAIINTSGDAFDLGLGLGVRYRF